LLGLVAAAASLSGLLVQAAAVARGMLAGQVLAVVLYARRADLGGANLGLLCLAVNVAVMLLVSGVAARASGRVHVRVL
jgi:SSS family solute:Na+ symporter